jgi:hypothetical protein
MAEMQKPSNSEVDKYYVFKESETETLAVSVEMLKQLKGNIAGNYSVGAGKKKRHNMKSLLPS